MRLANLNADSERSAALQRYLQVRSDSLGLTRHLSPEDYVVQSMPDVSPTKWHLAHTTWFFEQFVLIPFNKRYRVFDEQYHYLFNSYYVSAGKMHTRANRGLLTRPLVRDVERFREHVDEGMSVLLKQSSPGHELLATVELGLNHEQQHQELLLTDLKHVFFQNPLLPAANPELATPPSAATASHVFEKGRNGIQDIGASGEGFCFDNELPRHRSLLQEHAIGSRLISNAEYLNFIQDGGYSNADLWLSDGWASVQRQGWNRPLYWSEDLAAEFTLGGQRELDQSAPVAHVSYYEADAFARWAGVRLPTEFEWEAAAEALPIRGNLRESALWQPAASTDGCRQYYGDVWEWTSSAYLPYPGFTPLAGSLGEYNGKFMCNQMSVRGGSCVTAADHIRPTYRSFFYPDARWQFLGIRLAKDGAR